MSSGNSTRREFVKALGVGVGAAFLAPVISLGCRSAGSAGAASASAAGATGWDMVPGILARIKPPTFPNRDFDITRYGAVGDGTTDCTDAFRQAIAACAAAGGGRVVVPAGRFLTAAIHLRGNVDLHVTRGATVAFHQDPARYL